jgi:hypothetical protein
LLEPPPLLLLLASLPQAAMEVRRKAPANAIAAADLTVCFIAVLDSLFEVKTVPQ